MTHPSYLVPVSPELLDAAEKTLPNMRKARQLDTQYLIALARSPHCPGLRRDQVEMLELYVKKFALPARQYNREIRINDVVQKLKQGQKVEPKVSFRANRSVGCCRICGRELSDPESISRGIGPECAALVQGRLA